MKLSSNIKTEKILYFAYGSNLSITQMKARCPSSKLLQKGVLRNHKLVFNRYSSTWQGAVADIIKCEDRHVWGLIYEMEKDELQLLDSFEGYPNCYNRKLTTVYNSNQQAILNVWVYYIVHKCKKAAPAKRYLSIIKTAAYNFNFPKYYRDMLSFVKPAVEMKKNYETLLLKNPKQIFSKHITKQDYLKGLPIFEKKNDIVKISTTSKYTIDNDEDIFQDFEDEEIERLVRDGEV
jgi:gamma-glutamylcyclotransferase (GGCT)/AIG2-like uncharacterized protein YtfP